MVERFIDIIGTSEQLKTSDTMLNTSKLEFKTVAITEIIPNRLYSAKVRLIGSLVEISRFIKLLQSTY
jgi:hypothetical protein